MALERELQKAQQALHRLADKRAAAEAAHMQVGRKPDTHTVCLHQLG